MVRRERKSFSRSKKFDEIQQDHKAKLRERSIQKTTGYERDLRTMSKRILEPLRRAENGEEELTRKDLQEIKKSIDKLITRSRVLEASKGAKLNQIRSKLELERTLIADYIQGKQELPGLVMQKGEKTSKQQTNETDNGVHGNPDRMDFRSDFRKHSSYVDAQKSGETIDKRSYYKSLGFDVDHKQSDESDFIVSPVRKPKHIAAEDKPAQKETQDEDSLTNRRIIIHLVDQTISGLINSGIEHLMFYRRDRKADDPSYREELILFFEREVVHSKRRSMQQLRDQGFGEMSLRHFASLFDKEYAMNKNEMIRKCLYMSRVLEYRKGSTSSG